MGVLSMIMSLIGDIGSIASAIIGTAAAKDYTAKLLNNAKRSSNLSAEIDRLTSIRDKFQSAKNYMPAAKARSIIEKDIRTYTDRINEKNLQAAKLAAEDSTNFSKYLAKTSHPIISKVSEISQSGNLSPVFQDLDKVFKGDK